MKTNILSVCRQFVAATVLPLVLGASAPEASAQVTRDILVPAGTDSVWHGVWLPTKRTINASQITTFEAQAGKKVGAEIFYTGWYVNAWCDTHEGSMDQRALRAASQPTCRARFLLVQ